MGKLSMAMAGRSPRSPRPAIPANHLCFALEETGALFTGDHVMTWSTSVVSPPDGDMGDYMASLAKLYDREDRIYYAAHGAPALKPKQLVRGMIGHRKQRERQILKTAGKPRRTSSPIWSRPCIRGWTPA